MKDKLKWLDIEEKPWILKKGNGNGNSFRTEITQYNATERFDLGNDKEYDDPLKAAEKLLEREYGDTFLFHDEKQEPVFIPPVFTSREHNAPFANVANLNDDTIEKELQKIVSNYATNEEYTWLIEKINIYLESSEKKLHLMQEKIKEDECYKLIDRILKCRYGRSEEIFSNIIKEHGTNGRYTCLLYTSPSPRDS